MRNRRISKPHSDENTGNGKNHRKFFTFQIVNADINNYIFFLYKSTRLEQKVKISIVSKNKIITLRINSFLNFGDISLPCGELSSPGAKGFLNEDVSLLPAQGFTISRIAPVNSLEKIINFINLNNQHYLIHSILQISYVIYNLRGS